MISPAKLSGKAGANILINLASCRPEEWDQA